MKAPRQVLGLLALARMLHGQALPYNPARILLPPNSSFAYVFQSSSHSAGETKLLIVDIINALSSSRLPSDAPSESLPFLKDDQSRPYTPTIESDGTITVLTGNCSEGLGGTEVWRYAPKSDDAETKEYTWQQQPIQNQEAIDQNSLAGSNYLAASIAFSSQVQGDDQTTSTYIYGGMCPLSSSTHNTWQNDAGYSNSMLTLSSHRAAYDLTTTASRGPPIAQAGISITPLTPTYSANSSGVPVSQQQDFVLLGGHTQSAFVNTSQVAVFSLPLESWSFMEVQQPSDTKTDLAVRQSTQEVTPRSGHTAVLSETGTSIIVFGGWVGNVNTPAQPQLAVLELGAGFGGTGDWHWHVPDPSGQGLARGAGIYGHGAAMLPGDVMMVVGGYDIPTSSSKRIKRSTPSANSRLFFYNTTSNTWLQSYTPPSSLETVAQEQNGPLSNTSQRVGLGTGLGIGAALLVSLLAFYFWYSKRLRNTQEKRERALLTYSSDGSFTRQINHPFLENGDLDGHGGAEAAADRCWPTGGTTGSEDPRPPPMQHTTGMWVNVPSPTRGLRKGAPGKNYQYHPAPRYDEKRLSKASGNIHPIAELENEDGQEVVAESSEHDELSDAEAKLREVKRMLNPEDPFTDAEPNPLGSHPVVPPGGGTVRRVPTAASRISVPPRKPVPESEETANWTVDCGTVHLRDEEVDAPRSPTKSEDRTSSTLSERSQRSTTSTNSITRTMSTRTGALMATAAAAHRQAINQENTSPEERSNTITTIGSRSSTSYFRTRARSSTNDSVTPGAPQSAGVDGESFMTARSNFGLLQNEGEVLLGGRPTIDRDDPYQRALAAHSATQPKKVPTLNNHGLPPAIPTRRRPGWMGSLRRALNAVSTTDRSFSFTSSSEPYKDDPRSVSSSPTKERAGKLGRSPRRAASDGAALLRQKRGQSDWSEKDWAPYRDDPDAGDWGDQRPPDDQRRAEEDWDVEGAASRRDVQVMFTVPKAKLRVVNDDMDRASLRSASDSAVSRNGSVKYLRREESVKTLRAFVENEMLRLASTEEEKDDEEKQKAS